MVEVFVSGPEYNVAVNVNRVILHDDSVLAGRAAHLTLFLDRRKVYCGCVELSLFNDAHHPGKCYSMAECSVAVGAGSFLRSTALKDRGIAFRFRVMRSKDIFVSYVNRQPNYDNTESESW